MSLIDKSGVEAPASFEEMTRAAEAEAGIPSDVELYGEAWATPEPDETGRIPSYSPPRDETGEAVEVEEAPAEEAAEEPVEETPAEEPAPAPDAQVLAKLAELEAKNAELNAKVGTLVNENAEMRRAQAPTAQEVGWFEDEVDRNPAAAAYWALQNQQPAMYEQAIRSWHDIDPVAASRYERQVEMQALQEQWQAQISPQLQTAQDLAQKQDLEAAIQAVKAKHPDFDQVVGSLDEGSVAKLVQDGFPVDTLALLGGNAQQKQSALESLFRWVSHDHASVVQQAAPQVAAEAAEEAKERKRAATVASASTTTPPPVEESEGERMMRVWKDSRPSLRDGWTGRSGS